MARHVNGRRSIHLSDNEDSPRRQRHLVVEEEPSESPDDEEQSNVEEEDDLESERECNETLESVSIEWHKTEREARNNYDWYWIMIAVGSIIVVVCAFGISYLEDNTYIATVDCNNLQSENEDVLRNVEVAINECRQFKKPSVLLFLYRNMLESDVDKLLTNVSNYASCNLSGTNRSQVIELSIKELQSSEVKDDYGQLIEKYRGHLEERSVMVVRGLERVPGTAAQVFHSFCDEVSPVVEKSIFVFSMHVSSYEPADISDFRLVETTLKRNWHDLDVDIFEPLLARITSMIVRLT